MKVVIVGATGNVGTSLISSLATESKVEEVIGIARRKPDIALPKTTWEAADITSDDLAPHLEGADAVVHLAWAIQPSRDLRVLHDINVKGSQRVFDAAARARVPALVYASSVGTYSPGPKGAAVDERWPTDGISTSFYSVHKAEVERLLDRFEVDHPETRVVRLRPGLIFKKEAATGIRRLFLGPFVPGWLLHPRRLLVVPSVRRLVFQAVHSEDVAEAYRLAITEDVRGSFNIAAEPWIGPRELAETLQARRFPLPQKIMRGLMHLTWLAHLQPSPAGWFDMGVQTPLLDVTKATAELGWKPTRTGTEALLELLEGFADGASFGTPPLASDTTSPMRVRELSTRVGQEP